MKRQAVSHPKMLELADRLDIGRCFAVGIMETLWTWASEYALDGLITCSPRVLARSLDYQGDPEGLVTALEEAGFIDRAEGGGWLIHDWSEHCEDYVHTTLGRTGRVFADGTQPKLSRLSAEEREAVRRRQEEQKQRPAQNGAERRRTAQNGAGKSTTDTDTDTSLREDIHTYAEPEDQGEEQGPCQNSGSGSGSADLHADGGPKSVGSLIDAMTGGVRRQEAIEKKAYQIAGITRDGPEYHAYWVEVVKKALSAELLDDLEECLRYAASATDPAMRSVKDLGEMHSPGKWLVARMASLFHQKGLRMPKPPGAQGARQAKAATATKGSDDHE